MKTKILSLASAVVLLLGASACQDVHEFAPDIQNEPFDSMSASFFDDDRDENSFPAEFDFDNHVITVVVPYTYPACSDSYLEMADLARMKVQCNLKQGHVLEPALTWLDLSKDNQVTITDGYGTKTDFTIRAEIRMSSECEILDFTLANGLSGVINTQTNVIALASLDNLGSQLAEYDISCGATLSPDPRVEPIDFDNDPKVTCIAQNGVDKTEYTFVKVEPEKLPFGFREGSARILWAKKQSDLGLRVYSTAELESGNLRFNGSAGLGVVGEYLVLNDAGTNTAYVLNYKNGTLVKTIDLSALGTNAVGNGNNHRMTSDRSGNLLFAVSRFENNNVMSLWKMKGIDGQLVKLLDYNDYAAMANTLSVTGDLDGDAIITTTANGGIVAYRWEIKGGQLVNATPTKFTPGGYTGKCWGTMDIIYTEPNPTANYFSIGYIGHSPNPPGSKLDSDGELTINRTCQLLNGTTNNVISYGSICITSNSVENAGDYIVFNNSKYFIHNVVNTLGYGYGASLFMYDVTGGTLEQPALDFDGGDVAFRGNYGAEAANGTHDKGSNGNDVRFHVSDDGFYLYIFFEYCNGYVGCVRVDCIDM